MFLWLCLYILLNRISILFYTCVIYPGGIATIYGIDRRHNIPFARFISIIYRYLQRCVCARVCIKCGCLCIYMIIRRRGATTRKPRQTIYNCITYCSLLFYYIIYDIHWYLYIYSQRHVVIKTFSNTANTCTCVCLCIL